MGTFCHYRTKNQDRRWKSTQPNIFGMNVLDFQQQPLKDVPEICHTPYDFFKLFVDDQFADKTIIIVHQIVLSLS
jgi:hypothetical protein